MTEIELIARGLLDLVQMAALVAAGLMVGRSRWWLWPALASLALLIGTFRNIWWFDAAAWAALYAFGAGAAATLAITYFQADQSAKTTEPVETP